MLEHLVVDLDRRTGPDRRASDGFEPFGAERRRSDRRSGSYRRRFGRRYQDALYTNLGSVIDLSVGGMRIMTGRVPRGNRIQVKLISHEGHVTVEARKVWRRRVGLLSFRWEIGLEFMDVSEEMARTLTRISSSHRIDSRPGT